MTLRKKSILFTSLIIVLVSIVFIISHTISFNYYYIYCLLGIIIISILSLILFIKKMLFSRLALLNTSIVEIGISGKLSSRIEISGNDEIAHAAGAVNDILQVLEDYHHELEKKESYLRLVTNNMMDMIFQIDENGIIKYASSSSHHILGYKYENLIGKHFSKHIHPDDEKFIITKREEFENYNSKRIELRMKHRDGYYIWVETIISTLYDQFNNYVGIIYTSCDITDRKLVVEELKKAYDELEIRVHERTLNLSKVNEELCNEINERKRMAKALQYQVQFEELVAQISTNFINLNIHEIDNTINQSLQAIGKFVKADRCYIFMFSDNLDTMDNTHEWSNAGIDSQISNLKALPCESMPWWMQQLKALQNIIIPRISDLPPEAEVEKEVLLSQSIQSLVVVPMKYRNSIIGYLGFDWVKNEYNILDEDITLLSIASEIFANAFNHLWDAEKLAKQKEHLSVTLRSISNGVISIDTNGKILMINKAAEKITGWTTEEIKEKTIFDILKIIDRKTNSLSYNEIKKMLNTEKIYTISDNIILTKDNTKKIISCSSSPMIEKDNKVIGFVIVLRDITEKKKIEDRLTLSQKMESVGLLAAGVAHEINTPMQYIGDNTRFLKDAMNDLDIVVKQIWSYIEESTNNEIINADCIDKIKKMIDDADLEYLLAEIPLSIKQSLEGIDRVSKLVLTLKNFSHPGSKEKMLCDINQSINQTTTITRNEWKYASDMETILDPHIPMVYCVIDEINQVILNMIINAAHAIKEAVDKKFYAKGKITISTKSEGNYVKIIISDNGIGIPKSLINRIYDPFFTTKEVGKGTGQGLAITHDIIVNKHQGIIEVESEEGKGTTFTICLPLSDYNNN